MAVRGRVKEPEKQGDPESQRTGYSDSPRKEAMTPRCPTSLAEGLTKA